MPSGPLPTSIFLMSRRVDGSNIETLFSRPLLVNPCLKADAIATPCTPGVSGIVPTTFPLSASRTSTWVACETQSRRAVQGHVIETAGAADRVASLDLVAGLAVRRQPCNKDQDEEARCASHR